MKKKKILFVILVTTLFIGLAQPSGLLNAGTQEADQEYGYRGIPTLSPQETLKVYLNAFIYRDIDMATAHHPKKPCWQKGVKPILMNFMTKKRHIIAVESIELLSIETVNSVTIAVMYATLAVTPKFPGAENCDVRGRCTVSHTWTFVQYQPNGPWVYDGGGF
jgi:hypothetical protein